jgi:hypothetical protein
MTPERMAALVLHWARLYTRRLPEHDARRRVDELRADLHDHISHERAYGTGERRIAGSVAARMLRGIPADVSWRRERTRQLQTQEEHAMRSTGLARRSVARVALVTVLLLLIPLALMLLGDGTDWGVFDFVFAGAIIAGAGLLTELAVRSRGTTAYVTAAVAGTLGVGAMVAGEADDAPGLVGFGLLLLLSMIALTVRNVQRSQ